MVSWKAVAGDKGTFYARTVSMKDERSNICR